MFQNNFKKYSGDFGWKFKYKAKSGKIARASLFIGSAANAVVDGKSEAVFRYRRHGNVFVSGKLICLAQICKEIGSGLMQVAGRA